MKKIVLTIGILFSTILFATAQINKGSVLLGGGIGLNKGNSKNEVPGVPNSSSTSTQYGFSVYPTLGFAVKQNTVIGFNLNYGYNKDKADGYPYRRENNSYGGGFFTRRYLPLGKNFYLFGEAGIEYGFYKTDDHSPDTSYYTSVKNNQYSLYLYPGVSYAVSKGFQLEVGINNLVNIAYNRSQNSTNSSNGITTFTSKTNNLAFSTNASAAVPLTIGFRFFISK